MRFTIGVAILLASIIGPSAVQATAHEIKWNVGEPRLAAFGRCAKGPCTTRVAWSSRQPHRHVRGKVIITRSNHELWRID